MTQQEAQKIWDDEVQDTAQAWFDQHEHDEEGLTPPSDDYLRLAMAHVPDKVLEVMAPDEAWQQWRAAVLAYF